MILEVVRSSGGFAIAVTDEETLEFQNEIGLRDGLLLCPEGAATAVAYRRSIESGQISPEEHAILFNTATGLLAVTIAPTALKASSRDAPI